MIQSYARESDLIAGMGNYGDSIRNLVRGYQTYVDQFYNYIPVIYPEIAAQKGDYLPLVTFLFAENESIMRQKGIMFAIDSCHLVTRKFESLRTFIREHDEIRSYNLSKDTFSFVFDDKPYAEMISSSFNIYAKKSIPDNSELYKFEEYMDSVCNDFSKNVKKGCQTNYSPKELVDFLDKIYLGFSQTMLHLKELAENSSSVYITARITRSLISALVMSYLAIGTIEPIKKNAESTK